MTKIYFNFSYTQRFLAKDLDLQWDMDNKKWYCSDHNGFGVYQNTIFQIYMLLPIRLRLLNHDFSYLKTEIFFKIKSFNVEELKKLELLYTNNIIIKSNIIKKRKYHINYQYDRIERKINHLQFTKHEKYPHILIGNDNIIQISKIIPNDLREHVEKWVDLHEVDLLDLFFNGNIIDKSLFI